MGSSGQVCSPFQWLCGPNDAKGSRLLWASYWGPGHSLKGFPEELSSRCAATAICSGGKHHPPARAGTARSKARNGQLACMGTGFLLSSHSESIGQRIGASVPILRIHLFSKRLDYHRKPAIQLIARGRQKTIFIGSSSYSLQRPLSRTRYSSRRPLCNAMVTTALDWPIR